jgi:hypothetical protein
MVKFVMASLVNASPGADEAFAQWHSDVHMPEVVENGGFIKARRLKLVNDLISDQPSYQYLILYEGECEDPTRALEQLNAAHAAGKIQPSDTLDHAMWAGLFEETPGAAYPVQEK